MQVDINRLASNVGRKSGNGAARRAAHAPKKKSGNRLLSISRIFRFIGNLRPGRQRLTRRKGLLSRQRTCPNTNLRVRTF